jgi:hypothetical protein
MKNKLAFSDFIFAPDPSKQMTGITGEYFVCGELGKIDILALLTPKNNPLFDIIATNKTGDKYLIISVKTMGIENNEGWILNREFTKKQNNNNFYVVLVNLKIREPNEYYIYQFDDLVERINTKLQKLKNRKSKGKASWITFNLIDFNSDDHKRKNNWTLIQHHLQ